MQSFLVTLQIIRIFKEFEACEKEYKHIPSVSYGDWLDQMPFRNQVEQSSLHQLLSHGDEGGVLSHDVLDDITHWLEEASWNEEEAVAAYRSFKSKGLLLSCHNSLSSEGAAVINTGEYIQIFELHLDGKLSFDRVKINNEFIVKVLACKPVTPLDEDILVEFTDSEEADRFNLGSQVIARIPFQSWEGLEHRIHSWLRSEDDSAYLVFENDLEKALFTLSRVNGVYHLTIPSPSDLTCQFGCDAIEQLEHVIQLVHDSLLHYFNHSEEGIQAANELRVLLGGEDCFSATNLIGFAPLKPEVNSSFHSVINREGQVCPRSYAHYLRNLGAVQVFSNAFLSPYSEASLIEAVSAMDATGKVVAVFNLYYLCGLSHAGQSQQWLNDFKDAFGNQIWTQAEYQYEWPIHYSGDGLGVEFKSPIEPGLDIHFIKFCLLCDNIKEEGVPHRVSEEAIKLLIPNIEEYTFESAGLMPLLLLPTDCYDNLLEHLYVHAALGSGSITPSLLNFVYDQARAVTGEAITSKEAKSWRMVITLAVRGTVHETKELVRNMTAGRLFMEDEALLQEGEVPAISRNAEAIMECFGVEGLRGALIDVNFESDNL
ncbi:hypothetical protein [Neptuniibacter sp. QD37_11]|uniref:hypothetical protein n=1 Tax=Neptuniibacter sp. QD37_11 TaxID=3398209 RepID=UPI0039F510A7